MNPTSVVFIRQAEQERAASPADPATLSSLGIWHQNFNRKATQAGRSAEETRCACQSELTNWCEHSKSATPLAWRFEARREKGRRWQGKGVLKGSRGTSLSHMQVRAGGVGGWRTSLTRLCSAAKAAGRFKEKKNKKEKVILWKASTSCYIITEFDKELICLCHVLTLLIDDVWVEKIQKPPTLDLNP